MNATLNAALAYAEHGLAVFPCVPAVVAEHAIQHRDCDRRAVAGGRAQRGPLPPSPSRSHSRLKMAPTTYGQYLRMIGFPFEPIPLPA